MLSCPLCLLLAELHANPVTAPITKAIVSTTKRTLIERLTAFMYTSDDRPRSRILSGVGVLVAFESTGGGRTVQARPPAEAWMGEGILLPRAVRRLSIQVQVQCMSVLGS